MSIAAARRGACRRQGAPAGPPRDRLSRRPRRVKTASPQRGRASRGRGGTVDTCDLKAPGRWPVRVKLPPPAPERYGCQSWPRACRADERSRLVTAIPGVPRSSENTSSRFAARADLIVRDLSRGARTRHFAKRLKMDNNPILAGFGECVRIARIGFDNVGIGDVLEGKDIPTELGKVEKIIGLERLEDGRLLYVCLVRAV